MNNGEKDLLPGLYSGVKGWWRRGK